MRPDPYNLPAFYVEYVKRVENLEIEQALTDSFSSFAQCIAAIPEEKGAYRYAPGKWSIKEVLAHLNDTERIFAYRALRFARRDRTVLQGFDEQAYGPLSNAASRSLDQLIGALSRLRTTTIDLFRSFDDEMLHQTGIANKDRISVGNIGYVTAGHMFHHLQVLKDRYLA